MITFLDLLVIVSMLLITAGVLSSALMFLIKSSKVRRVCFYLAAALGVYVGFVGFKINWPGFYHQAILAAVLALVGIGALVFERIKKNDAKAFLYARIAACASLLVGIANALLI